MLSKEQHISDIFINFFTDIRKNMAGDIKIKMQGVRKLLK